MLDEKIKERLRSLTVEILLALRSEYFKTGQANALKNWDILQSRMRSASRTCQAPEEWATHIARNLQIGALGLDSSRCLTCLSDYVREAGCAREWLDLTERETGHLMALCRLAAEQRKEAREAAKEKTDANTEI